MVVHSRTSHPRSPSYVLPCVIALSFFSLTALFLYKVDDFATRTKTIAGHNLEPTPWHPFPRKDFTEETRQSRAFKIIQCSYLACRYGNGNSTNPADSKSGVKRWRPHSPNAVSKCPEFFNYIRKDLEPWAESRISINHVMEAQKFAAFRIVITGGRLFVDLYYACVQSRQMFTIWGFAQLLRRFPGMVPDIDMMFDCMDKPIINRSEHQAMPLPLFRYCTTPEHFDIPFPDWSFWGWPEINIRTWDEEFHDIKKGSKSETWTQKTPLAYWKGNPDVASPLRLSLLECNDTNQWGAQIMRQNWSEEARRGFEQSKLSNQCKYRYKIYAEGYAWSVSLKYIISCGSMALIISPQYEDFFSRGLVPTKHYWPVSTIDLCWSIKNAVEWGNNKPDEAKAIGKAGQDYMESLSMDRIYDYMFNLIMEYSKLLDYEPVPPSSAQEVCSESLMCLADPTQREFLENSMTSPSPEPPCSLHPAKLKVIDRLIEEKQNAKDHIKMMETDARGQTNPG
ncbi:hypothetical protein ACFE04_016121 [Oxalis oulophora]